MRFLLLFVFSFLLLTGCGMQKKPENQVKEHTPDSSVPENLGDPNAPTEVRALQGAHQVQDRLNEQRKEDSKVLQEADH